MIGMKVEGKSFKIGMKVEGESLRLEWKLKVKV